MLLFLKILRNIKKVLVPCKKVCKALIINICKQFANLHWHITLRHEFNFKHKINELYDDLLHKQTIVHKFMNYFVSCVLFTMLYMNCFMS